MLRWSAIQTLLERSTSDCLILLDCCAGAASATFPNGKSITETISASSWDAIAPDPGRYSFTNALIEVLQEWRMRTFSAAMLHAEILARLKHPRPITINGKHFEARSTPVHFMMTTNHKAPSIEMSRILPEDKRPPSPPQDEPVQEAGEPVPATGRGPGEGFSSEPNENEPHVMISLALEADQQLDLNAWQQWLSAFPGLAKYVKVQGVFQSHSTLLLLSMPVMVWDLLPEDHACSFVAFIRSNNLFRPQSSAEPSLAVEEAQPDSVSSDHDLGSIYSGPTLVSIEIPTGSSWSGPGTSDTLPRTIQTGHSQPDINMTRHTRPDLGYIPVISTGHSLRPPFLSLQGSQSGPSSSNRFGAAADARRELGVHRTVILNQSRSAKRTLFSTEGDVPEGPALSSHISSRLEAYFQRDPEPSMAFTEFIASNLGIETSDVDVSLLKTL